MKKLIVRTLSFAASLAAVIAINGTSSAYAAADKDVSSLNLSVMLKNNAFTYTGSPICPEYTVVGSNTGWTSGEYKGTNYTIGYRYNINAGTGRIVATGTGGYSGQETLATFTIAPMNVKSIPDFKIDVGEAAYTGKPVLPYVEVASGFRTLKESVDYTVSAVRNTNVGYAVATVKFIGNYTGEHVTSFKVDYAPINHFSVRQEAGGNVLKWDKVKCDKISVYRHDLKTNSDILIGTTTNDEFIDTSAPQFSEFQYFVQSQATYNGKQYYSKSKVCSVSTTLNAPRLEVALENGAARLSWNRNPDAQGYIIFMDDTSVASISDKNTTTYTVNNINPSDKHKFSMVSFTTRNGKFVQSPRSEERSTYEEPVKEIPEEQKILDKAKKGDRRSFKLINSQKEKDSLYATIKLTDNDFAILEKFAKEHFTEDMTDSEKLLYTLEWINMNTKYASSSSDWNKIGNKSYVDAIFNLKLGQCAQYNGAMVSMMRYLGYEANLILGWRGSWPSNYWQHLWGEIEIDGTKYLIETGNYGRSGGWSFFLVPYNRADGRYIINCKNIELDYGGWWYY